MTRRQKKVFWRIVAAAVLFAAGELVPLAGFWKLIFYLPAYVIIGGDVLKRAARNILRGQVFDENFLMSIATLGAFATAFYDQVSGAASMAA